MALQIIWNHFSALVCAFLGRQLEGTNLCDSAPHKTIHIDDLVCYGHATYFSALQLICSASVTTLP